MFTQTIYYTITANIKYPWWFYEYLKFFSFSSFEYHLFPHILSEQIFNTDKYKNDVYDFRFKWAGMYHNSGAINTECKIEILAVYFLFLMPIALILSVFIWFTFVLRGVKCAWLLDWPTKFFYSATNMLMIMFM